MAIHWPHNTRNWDPEARQIVREIERLYDVHCYTYPNHGPTAVPESGGP